MKLRLLPAVLALSFLSVPTAWSHRASAQQAPSFPDEVKLKDGSIFRGTIVELVPKDHVDLLLANGQTRRFPIADVAYAGTAARPPRAAPPPAPAAAPPGQPPPPPNRVPVHVQSDQQDVQLLVRTGQGETEGVGFNYGWGWGWGGVTTYQGVTRDYHIICTAPCDTQVPPGIHRLALSHHGGRAVEANPVEVQSPSTLAVHYESRAGTRVLGWVIAIGTAVVGAVLMVEAIPQCDQTTGACGTMNGGEFWGGLGLALGGALVGGILAAQRDQAHIEVIPMSMGRLVLPRMESAALATPADTPGLGLRLRF